MDGGSSRNQKDKDRLQTIIALDDHSFALIALHSLPAPYQPVTVSLFHQTSISSADVFFAIQADVSVGPVLVPRDATS